MNLRKMLSDRVAYGWDTEDGWFCFSFHYHPRGKLVWVNFLGFFLNASLDSAIVEDIRGRD